MADAYGNTAVALDTYASALAWAQRQAGEVIASGAKEEPRPVTVELTVTQQAELTGVITGADESAPIRVDQRALALSTYRRALATLETVGNESAAAIRTFAELMPVSAPALPAVSTAPPVVLPTPAAGMVVHAVVPAPKPRPWFDPTALRDDQDAWDVAIKGIRKRLRCEGLNRLSPRLAQHIFDGHYRPDKGDNTGHVDEARPAFHQVDDGEGHAV